MGGVGQVALPSPKQVNAGARDHKGFPYQARRSLALCFLVLVSTGVVVGDEEDRGLCYPLSV